MNTSLKNEFASLQTLSRLFGRAWRSFFPGVESLRTLSWLKIDVHVLRETSHWEVVQWTSNKCTKKVKKAWCTCSAVASVFLTLSLSLSMPYHAIFLMIHPFQAWRAKVFPSVVADDPFQFYSFPIGLVQRRSFPNFYCCVLTPLV